MKPWDSDRERIMAERLENLFCVYAATKTVHVCGWEHLIAAPGMMYTYLAHLNPTRLLLD
jgi:hypothetical protein